MSSPSDRLVRLEAELAEVRAMMASDAPPARRSRIGLLRRVALFGLALALVIPAGIVLAGGQTFADVPPTHQFFTSIEAVADAGVTTGCGDGTNYCPNGLVTRGQMAAFMNRLGALAPGSSPKVNATELDGLDSSAFARPLMAVVNADGTLARGVGADGVATAGTGNYRVSFDRNIRNCAYTATIGLAGASGTETPGFITVVGDALDVNGVYVTTDDIAGASANRAFHLAVTCAGQTGGTAGILEVADAITPADALASGENQ
jgi:hypothetical protein